MQAILTSQMIQTEPRLSHNIIGVRHLEKRFGQVHAVKDINLSIERGQIYGFLGPNGAGKTTTIRMILGLIRPTKGEIRIFGEALSGKSLRRIGSLVESPSAYGHLTGRENLEVIRTLRQTPKSRVAEVLELVGLTDAANRVVRNYSLGMKGRLSLAAALLHEPELLILDEPTNGLDPQGIREIRDLIRGLPALGITVLVSSHLLSEVEQIATHLGIVSAGKMRFEGSLEGLRSKHQASLLIQVSDVAQAIAILGFNQIEAQAHPMGIQIFAMQQAARANRLLIEAGIEVSQLTTHNQSLEDLFLEMTKEA